MENQTASYPRLQMLICDFTDLLKALGIHAAHDAEEPCDASMVKLYRWLRESHLGHTFIEPGWDGIFIGHINTITGQTSYVADLVYPFERRQLLTTLRNIRHVDIAARKSLQN